MKHLIDTSEKALIERAVAVCFQEATGNDVSIPSKAEAESDTSFIYKLKTKIQGHQREFFVKAFIHFTVEDYVQRQIIRALYKKQNLAPYYLGLIIYNELPKNSAKYMTTVSPQKGLYHDQAYLIEQLTDPRKDSVLIEIQRWIEGSTLAKWLEDHQHSTDLTEEDEEMLSRVASAIASWHLERDYESVNFDVTSCDWDHILTFSEKQKTLLYENHLRDILQRVYKHRPLWRRHEFIPKSKMRKIHALLEESIIKFGVHQERLVSLHGDLRDRNIKDKIPDPEAPLRKREILCVDPHTGGYGEAGWDLGRLIADFDELAILYKNEWYNKAARFLIEDYASKTNDDGKIFQTCTWGLGSRFVRKVTDPNNPRRMGKNDTELYLELTRKRLESGMYN